MTRSRHRLCCAAAIVVLALLPAGCVRVRVHGTPPSPNDSATPTSSMRIATYNTSLNDDAAGGLIRRLEAGDANAKRIAAVLQRVRPDVVLLNEFDYDDAHRAADLFQRDYLERPQAGGGDALRYPYRYLAPVNTGVASGLDLDADGHLGTHGRDGGNDAWGYGLHPGQYGMLVLSRYPVDAAAVRTFRLFQWSAMPDASRPIDPATGRFFHADAIWRRLRLSSKSHWDVPIATPAGTVHFLVAHPTPPVFDGPEDRNGARNADEIRFWREYVSPGARAWLCDDAGHCGGLRADARFVIAGDLNNDPVDGDGRHDAIVSLLRHPRLLQHAAPRSDGGAQIARDYAAKGIAHRGAAQEVTGDFGAKVGALRLDYVLPSAGFELVESGVFWPAQNAPGAELIGASDHHLVWIDVTMRAWSATGR